MKRMLFLLTPFVIAINSHAQNYPKSVTGIRAGINISTLQFRDFDNDPGWNRVGFHAGVSEQILITGVVPVYIETGVYYTTKGAKQTYYDAGQGGSVSEKYNMDYLLVPLALSYHIQFGNKFGLQPFFGVYYGYGLDGKYKYNIQHNGGMNSHHSYNLFGKGDYEQISQGDELEMKPKFRRSDFGVRLGLTATYGRWLFGMGYEQGFADLVKFVDYPSRIHNRNISFFLGYNF